MDDDVEKKKELYYQQEWDEGNMTPSDEEAGEWAKAQLNPTTPPAGNGEDVVINVPTVNTRKVVSPEKARQELKR